MAAGGKLALIAYMRGYESVDVMMRALFTHYAGVTTAIAKDLDVERNTVNHWRRKHATWNGTEWVLNAAPDQPQPIPDSHS